MTSTPQQRAAAAPRFSVAEAKAAVRDLATPDLRRYWADLVIAAGLGWASFAGALLIGRITVVSLALYAVAVLLLYRAAVFIHELAHFGKRANFRWFRRIWNLTVGFPLLTPSFLYERHSDHHSKRFYATGQDGEYLAFARMSPWQMVAMPAAGIVAPLFGPWRFGVLAPISWCVPRARDYVYARMSTLKIDLDHRGRPPRPGAQRRAWLVQEICATLLVWGVTAGVITGTLPVALVLWWAALVGGIVVVNSMRLLGAHRYLAGDDGELSVIGQMLDTVNYPRSRIAGMLWGPLGLRLHALHHLLPHLPYHALPEAHERLVAALPADSAYRLTESRGLVSSIRRLWRHARDSRSARHALERGDRS
ncbi:fatty acid desaturase [Nocardia sp. CDC159]|uniref:Fatty acid desaturase n=1 Tax=Nocardia pulmonis TaxID=2951408 RepID=A0A9X2EE07_9NOCA|nr:MULTISPECIES: fatty acid desaturase [Nocardia]MCM6776371.1 fatty acid desaturase [Nocardia pulmonis]MCM6788795.1 fatty acid desaturase [Nocardia sp. CDC159]